MRSVMLALAVASAGCVSDATVVCGDLRCPVGATCTPDGCADRDQLAECAGHPDNDPCTTPRISVGACVHEICQPQVCGDRLVVGLEVCDDGNQQSGDGCSGDCRSTEVCGNAIGDLGEQCDDGNAISRDGCSSGCKIESPNWYDVTPGQPTSRLRHGAAYDTDRHVVVMYGGQDASSIQWFTDTWEWDGGNWRRILTRHHPPPARALLAYDTARHETVAWVEHETWIYDGVDWVQRTTGTDPVSRYGAMAYDPDLAQIVLVGEDDENVRHTHTWDGTGWTLAPSATTPNIRINAMAFDGVTRRVIATSDRTYAWFGGAWVPIGPSVGGIVVTLVTAGSDRVLAIKFVGPDTSTYRWNGAGWDDLSRVIPYTYEDAAAYDSRRERVVLFGTRNGDDFKDTYEYPVASHAWVRVVPDAGPSGGDLADRPDGLMLFAPGDVSYSGVWWWRGTGWQFVERATTPASSGCFAGTGAGALSYGGYVDQAPTDRTYLWRGDRWELALPASSPPAMSSCRSVYDDLRDRVVLVDAFVDGRATWEWDGTTWTQILATTSLPWGASFVFDHRRGVVVAFGGRIGDTPTNQLWEYDGHAWTEHTPAVSPPARPYPAMAYDPRRGTIVMQGGDEVDRATWEYDGRGWSIIDTADNPPYDGAMAFDRASGSMLLVVGDQISALRYESHFDEPDVCTSYDTDGDGAVGCADADCRFHCEYCGDGTCAYVESRAICPADCGG